MRVRDSALGWWLVSVAIGAVTALTLQSAYGRAAAIEARFGHLVDAVVAGRDIAAGEVVDAGDVRVERRPRAMVPVGALASAAAVTGRTARVELAAGEVIVRRRLAPGGTSGPTAMLADGARAIAVPAGPGGRPPLRPGDRVDVLATFSGRGPPASDQSSTGDPSPATGTSATDTPATRASVARESSAGGDPTIVVAAGALVIAVDARSDTVTVAVDASLVPAVAYAISTATITLALTP